MHPHSVIGGKVWFCHICILYRKLLILTSVGFKLTFFLCRLKKISACCVESNGENLLIGTENGNIYIMDLLQQQMTESVIYLDVVMQK